MSFKDRFSLFHKSSTISSSSTSSLFSLSSFSSSTSSTSTSPPQNRNGSCPAFNSQLNPCRVVVLGETGVGKTALIVRFLTKRFLPEYAPNRVDWSYERNIALNGRHVHLSIKDVSGRRSEVKDSVSISARDLGGGGGGHSDPDRDREQEPNGPHIVFVVYSVTDRKSFKHAVDLVRAIRSHGPNQSNLNNNNNNNMKNEINKSVVINKNNKNKINISEKNNNHKKSHLIEKVQNSHQSLRGPIPGSDGGIPSSFPMAELEEEGALDEAEPPLVSSPLLGIPNEANEKENRNESSSISVSSSGSGPGSGSETSSQCRSDEEEAAVVAEEEEEETNCSMISSVLNHHHDGLPLVCLLGNKSDLSHAREVSEAAGRQLAASHSGVVHMEVSAALGAENVTKAFLHTISKALQNSNTLPLNGRHSISNGGALRGAAAAAGGHEAIGSGLHGCYCGPSCPLTGSGGPSTSSPSSSSSTSSSTTAAMMMIHSCQHITRRYSSGSWWRRKFKSVHSFAVLPTASYKANKKFSSGSGGGGGGTGSGTPIIERPRSAEDPRSRLFTM